MRIWSKQAFAEINRRNHIFIQEYSSRAIPTASTVQIGIVGGGPKGVYAIERLASVWNTHLSEEKLEIICFNTDTSFGCGPNYSPDQPDYLLINYSLGNVNFWTDEPEQLVKQRDSLLDFINNFQEGEYKQAQPEDFCSRALTGIYLQHCLCEVIASLPDNIGVRLVPNTISFVEKIDGKINLFSKAGKLFSCSEVIFCTGHSYSFQDELTRQIKKVTSHPIGLSYIENVYPVSQLNSLEFSEKTVLVQGMGLTFVDAALALTEGQGGKFVCNEGKMTYVPSGKEPEKIYPFSRSGLPMLAREAGCINCVKLNFFTDRFVKDLLQLNRKLDFEKEIYPTIELEYRHQFAINLLTRSGFLFAGDAIGYEIDELEALAHANIPDFAPFDLENFLLPIWGDVDHHAAVLSYINQSLTFETLPITEQATLEMAAVWRAIYPNFRILYSFGRLTGKSQEKVDKFYFGKFQRVSYGPPIWNMRKIHALATAGIIQFDIGPSPSVHFNYTAQKFEVTSSGKRRKKIESNTLINARIAKGGSLNTQPKLYQNLYKTSGAEFFQNEGYRPGCFKMNEGGALLPHKEITLNGTPTEGWTLDNESLSRSNNNFISPWANKLVRNHVNRTPQTNPYCPSMD